MNGPGEPWTGHVRGSRGYRGVLIGLAAAGMATFAQLYSLQGVLPALAADLDISASSAALTVSAATLGLAAAVIPWAAAADRFGRLPVMRVAILAAVVLGLGAGAPDPAAPVLRDPATTRRAWTRRRQLSLRPAPGPGAWRRTYR